MNKEEHPKPDYEEEFARFVKKAEEIQAEDAAERFDEAVTAVLAKKRPKPVPKDQ